MFFLHGTVFFLMRSCIKDCKKAFNLGTLSQRYIMYGINYREFVVQKLRISIMCCDACPFEYCILPIQHNFYIFLFLSFSLSLLTNKWRNSCLDFLFQFLILTIQILAIEVIILRWIDTRGWRSQKQILQSRKEGQPYHLCQKIKSNREKIIF